jgi:hypothetical protein
LRFRIRIIMERGRRLERGVRRRAGLSAWRRSAFVTRPHPAIVPWTGDQHRISDDILWCGRRAFCRRHSPALARGRGRAGRAADRRCRDGGDGSPLAELHVQLSDYIPLNATSVRRIAGAVAPLAFDRCLRRVVGPANIARNAKAAFDMSVQRYIAAISG